jgi:hypothetical protein
MERSEGKDLGSQVTGWGIIGEGERKVFGRATGGWWHQGAQRRSKLMNEIS